ncbi:aldehyde dehydrogenase (NADP(+)) [Pseudarthrobacter sp. J75]|uniref:aldehyde dehydrogenase (NADP(+)) n=1 Tax=unclassified Pseudarthrobacter TaxID=2647000 RepID=UPI002E805B2C|nr:MULTISPECIES: aldehyde dehydrogenase (NADP(+)) [unclassified Pseudarthrobacter]MEE2521973.1 aldehyde dehydrogenase (NADP(+)) [Pseudarthrobacter sp. J47]MEE2528898.1 aldehyde dehydrogenase (NADP(+)) [Pseudarthrobacter sp. J75]MEE2569905.1 aldehyde dehydrogenase (NADP(+)) [Pseudarthrobacter sp. J64]
MTLTGHSLIAGQPVAGEGKTTFGLNPATNQALEPAYTLLTEDQLKQATAAAAEAYASFSTLDPETHAAFLEAIADNIEAIGDELITRAGQETGLPAARLQGERARTTGQLRLFAGVVRQGDFRGVRIDPAIPDRTPLPRADIRQRQIPLGPVAVFGASNFPLAFSTAGGDTASALAAGCPVVFKAHNAHPGTSELVGHAVTKAVKDLGLHPGVFSLIYGPGASIGQALVADPAIKAVGFTGSQAAGISLMRTAAARPEPIPVYAEMSSLNPVFVFEGALKGDIDALAAAYVTAVTGSSGQLCTSPGLLFAPTGEAGDKLAAAVGRAVAASSGQTMLTEGIASSWNAGTEALGSADGVELLGQGTPGATENAPGPAIFGTGVEQFVANHVLHEEIFGAASLVIRYSSVEDLLQAATRIEGQLTASLQLTEEDYPTAAPLIPVLEQKVGRIIVNGWPTGVEVGHAMVHGGPFPATSDSRTTSVGTLAINRFLRPVAYQNLPQELLPQPLQDANPWHLNRRIDGNVVSAQEAGVSA